jgi:hypothetical protein
MMRPFTLLFSALMILLFACKTNIGHQELDLSAEEQIAYDLAQGQLDAYNARDIDAFMSMYSDSIKIYAFPDQLISSGQAEMRERYATMFESTPDLYCMLVKRIVQGNTVIDQELITRKKDEPKVHAIAIYTIGDGKIQEVRFIK